MSQLRPALVLLVLFTVVTGLLYPLAITGIGQTVFPAEANGSLVLRNGAVVGSALVGQDFATDRYFHGRPSATTAPDPADPARSVPSPYNAANSAGSNLGPGSGALLALVESRAHALGPGPQPADLVTASASGLDPDISPEGALAQVARVAWQRGLDIAKVTALVERQVAGPDLGILGAAHVNVLALNLALDAMTP